MDMDSSPLQIRNFINGEFVDARDGETLENIGPYDGSVVNLIPRSKAEDVEDAVIAALNAYPSWSALSFEQRASILEAIADRIEQRAEEFAIAEALDTGKPLSLTRVVDIPRTVSNFRFFAQAVQQHGTSSFVSNGALNYSLRQPIGVAGLITPWNLPAYLLSWKVAPALAMGNCVVCKPSEFTPSTASLLGEVFVEVGAPPGIYNVVHGLGVEAGQPILEHKNVKLISFTGGTVTGRRVASTCAPLFKKLSLELGGKNPTLVFADCDFEKTVAGTARAAFLNQGQVCLCGSRIFVHESIFDRYVEAFTAKAIEFGESIGLPLQEETKFGSLISMQHLEKIEFYVKLAQEEGGKILCGGKRPDRSELEKGAFFLPTVIVGLDPRASRCAREEIFGPVVSIHPFSTDDEAVELANLVDYGLAASIWTENLKRAHTIGARVECGIVWVNCWLNRDLRTPFGGWKESGVGREGGIYSLDFFSEAKNICIQL